MSKITPEVVKKISRLSCIGVSDEELGCMAKDLDSILQWITQLQSIDVSNIDLHQNCLQSMPESNDIVTEQPETEAVLSNAPDRVESWFAVPKIIG